MLLNKSQLQEWLNHPVTRALQASIYERIEEGHLRILHSTDPMFDSVAKGIILGLKEVLEWRPETLEKDEDEVST